MMRQLRSAAVMMLTAWLWVSPLQAQEIEGTWGGSIDAGAAVLRVYFTFTRDDAGNLTGVADNPAQSSESVPLSLVTFDGSALHAEIAVEPAATYDGTFNADPRSFTGTYSQNGATFPLDLVPSEIVRPVRPQEPKPPFPYNVEEVGYDNAAASVHLAGTLTTPRRRGPHPAVLLITGSGAQDRDETLVGHKPFLVIADYLTRRGIAVLRVDDRSVGGSTGDFAKSTSEDFTGDVLAGVDYLKSRRDIDPERIGLIGHSEGGIIAPAAAARSKDVAFIVLLAGPGVPGHQLLSRQIELLQGAASAPADYSTFMIELSQELLNLSVAESDDTLAQQRMAAYWNERKTAAASSQLSAETKALIASADTDAAIASSIQELRTPWMKYFLAYDPAPALTQVTCPVLALNGTLDLQVEAEQNLPAIAAALEAGQNTDYTVTALDDLNHLFQPATTGSTEEYAQIETTIDPTALRAISSWLRPRVSRSASAPLTPALLPVLP